LYYEVSARSGHNITDAFVALCSRMMEVKKEVMGVKLKSNRHSKAVDEALSTDDTSKKSNKKLSCCKAHWIIWLNSV